MAQAQAAPVELPSLTPLEVHESAVKAVLAYQQATTRTPAETSAKDAVKSYNERRKAATAALKPALQSLDAAFKNGMVAGCSSMKDWCKQVNVLSYARVRQIITGKSGNEGKGLKVKSLDPSTPVQVFPRTIMTGLVEVKESRSRGRYDLRLTALTQQQVDDAIIALRKLGVIGDDPTPEPLTPTPVTHPVPYIPAFLTPEEHDALFEACDGLPFSITQTRWGKDVLHSSMTFGPEGFKMRSGYNGDFSLLKDAPNAIKRLQQKLSEYAGKTIDYLSVVRYRDGNDGMTWHQHSEDRHGQDASVWIVRTGTERTLSIRKKGEKGRGAATHILMAKGSLAVLPSSFNGTHEHAVLKYKNAGMCYSINCKVLPTDNKPDDKIELHKPRVYDCHAGKKYPDDAVYVGCRTERNGTLIREGSIFGNAMRPLECRGPNNPAIAHDDAAFRPYALALMANPDNPEFRKQVESLRGRDLLCWCKDTDEFCHARVWLELANA